MNREKILVRGVNWLGDAVLSTPALLRLRAARPTAHITLLTREKLADLWRAHPALDEVMTFAKAETVWQLAARLRRERFDVALVLPNSPRSALEVWLARIPQRIGYAAQSRNWWLTHPVARRPDEVRMRKRTVAEIKTLIDDPRETAAEVFPRSAHQVYHYLKLVAVLGANVEPLPPQICVTPDEVEAVCRQYGLAAEAQPHRLLLGLNPGAEYGPAKRWPAERFVAAALEIQKRRPCRWLIFGSKADHELAAEIASQIGPATCLPPQPSTLNPQPSVLNLAGATTLRELCALLKACRLLLTNDSGPMHVAAAAGTPVLALFGSTSPDLTGPAPAGELRHQILRSNVPCSPCFLASVRSIFVV